MSKDAQIQCEPKVFIDAEAQCDTPRQRTVAIQTLAQRKRKPLKNKNASKNVAPSLNAVSSSRTPKPVTSPTTPNTTTPITTTPIISSDSEISLGSSDDIAASDSDDDYTYLEELDTDEESEGEELKNQRKFIVFESMLDKLFATCRICGSLCEIEKSHIGSMVAIKTTCSNNHTYQWKSQPDLHNKPAGNILIPAATIMTGGTYEATKQFANAINLNFVNKDQFYEVQNKIVFPVIDNVYKKQQKEIIETIKNKMKPVDLCGDGRSDSPGHSAKYGTYTLMDETSEKIIDFSLVQVSEVSSSNAMEKKGCQRALDNVIEQGVKVRSLTTDRHIQITSEMRKRYPSIVHQYDVWHLSKWVTKKLTEKAKKKENHELLEWIQSVSNHLWWCAQSCQGNAEVLHEKWVSILHHIVNKHNWRNSKHFCKCAHGPLSKNKERKTKWLQAGSAPHIALEEVVLNRKLLKDIKQLTEFHHTGNLEVYHSLLLKYVPKRKHFSYKGMVARTQLAVIDHNSNTGRRQATVTRGKEEGEKRYKVVFPKGRKKWIVKPVLEKKCFDFVLQLMDDVVEFNVDMNPQPSDKHVKLPKNIAPTPRPSKKEVIAAHRSRMAEIHT